MSTIGDFLRPRRKAQILPDTQAGRHELSAQETHMRGGQVRDVTPTFSAGYLRRIPGGNQRNLRDV